MSRKKDKSQIKHGEWEWAIREASKRLARTEQLACQLRESIAIFRKKQKKGEAWPMTQSEGQDSGQQHNV